MLLGKKIVKVVVMQKKTYFCRAFQKASTMDTLKSYDIPIKGLNFGQRSFEFAVDTAFFKAFEHSSIEDGAVEVQLRADKRANMVVLDFEINGTVKAECDRCAEEIDLPLTGTQQITIKYSELPREEEDDIIYLHPDEAKLNVSGFIYELIHLSVPMRKLTPACEEFPEDCENNFLMDIEYDVEPDDTDEDDDSGSSVWDILNNFREE